MFISKVLAAGKNGRIYEFPTPVDGSYREQKAKAFRALTQQKYQEASQAFALLDKAAKHKYQEAILYVAVCGFYLEDPAEHQKAYEVLHDFFSSEDIFYGFYRPIEDRALLDTFALYYLTLSLHLGQGIPQYLVQNTGLIPPYLSSADLEHVLNITLSAYSEKARDDFMDNVIGRDFARLHRQVTKTGKIDWHYFLTNIRDESGSYTIKVRPLTDAAIYHLLALLYRSLHLEPDKKMNFPGTPNKVSVFLEAEDIIYGNTNPHELFLRAARQALTMSGTKKKKYHELYKFIGEVYLTRGEFQRTIDNYEQFICHSSDKAEKEHLKEVISKLKGLVQNGITFEQLP